MFPYPPCQYYKKGIWGNTTNISNMKILKVFNVETVISERTGNPYVRVSFRAATLNAEGVAVFTGLEKGTRIVFEGEEPNEGDVFAGGIYKFDTTPYTIDGKEVKSCKVVAFEGEDATKMANELLAAQGHNACVLKADGTPTIKLKKKKVVVEEPETEEAED